MVTSVSRSGPGDETPGGTGTGVSADRGSSAVPAPGRVDGEAAPSKPTARKPAAKRAPAKSAAAKSTAAKSTTAKSAAAKSTTAKSTTAKPAAPKSTTARSTTARSAATESSASPGGAPKRTASRTTKPRPTASVAAERVTENVELGPADAVEAVPAKPEAGAADKAAAKSKPAARKPTARTSTAKKPAARPASNTPASETPEAAPQPTAESKRTAASRAASSSAAAKRGAAAKAARTPSVSLAQAKERAADARKKAAARQRVAAAMTTDTTEAERAPRKSEPAVSAGAAGSAGAAVASAAAATSVPEAPAVEAEAPEVELSDASTATAAPVAEPDAAPTTPDAAPNTPDAQVVVPSAAPAVDAGAPPADSVAAEVETVPSAVDGTPGDEAPGDEAPADTPGATPDAVGDPERTVGDERGVAVIPVGVGQQASPRKKRTLRVARPAPVQSSRVLAIEGLVKRYGDTTAVDAISLDVKAGSFYGIVGPNGAGKTTTLSMVTGLLRPDAGTVRINDIDVWKDPRAAKRATGVLPDRLRLFDRLTGSELLYYSGSLRGLDHRTVLDRSADLAAAFGLEDALDRLVADYSAGMTKKIALACAMIHSPRLLVLDEPFESVDPVSAANLTDILERYVAGGGTVLLSSHSMDLIERVCDSAAIIVGGRVLASGALDEVRQGQTLEDRFVELAGGRKAAEGLEWLHSFSD